MYTYIHTYIRVCVCVRACACACACACVQRACFTVEFDTAFLLNIPMLIYICGGAPVGREEGLLINENNY
jgi:hypothetical protein